MSISTNCFPGDWKCAKVSPRFKTGKTELCCHYRPILVLLVLCLEEHIHVHLSGYFLSDNNLILDTQSGFRAGHSCQTALTNITNAWHEALDMGILTGVLL